MRDIKSNVDAQPSINPGTFTATESGAGVDLRDFDSAMVVFNAGTADTANANETYIPSIEASDDDGATDPYTAVAASDLDGDLSTILQNTTRRIGYKGNKRWIKGVLTLAGTTPSIDAGAMVMRGNPHQAPVA